MNDPSKNERTETDERIEENRGPAPRRAIPTEGETDPATGLPKGQHDDDRSPLD